MRFGCVKMAIIRLLGSAFSQLPSSTIRRRLHTEMMDLVSTACRMSASQSHKTSSACGSLRCADCRPGRSTAAWRTFRTNFFAKCMRFLGPWGPRSPTATTWLRLPLKSAARMSRGFSTW
ncbi:unnamed protein product [Amoebophrya sp. A120]|nr:unnamed protein product [Amoebophrya sp. A120]|eukprot:GSA120T00025041001.1